MVYNIPEFRIEKFEKKLETIKKKCEQYGCDFYYNKGKAKPEEFKTLKGKVILNVVPVTVVAKAIIKGWRFVGLVEHYTSANVVKTIDYEEVPKEFYHCKGICEHCKTNRYRKNTYIIQNIETSEYKQVGKECLKSYTGGLDAELVASFESIFDYVDADKEEVEEFRNIPSSEFLYNTEEVFSAAYEIIQKHGYQKANDEGKITTAMLVDEAMSKTIFDTTKGKEIREWLLNNNEESGYILNLKTIAKEGYVSQRDFKLAVSAPASFSRAQEREERKKNQVPSTSEFQANVGDRISRTIVAYKVVKTFYDEWHGSSALYSLRDENGNIYKWFTSSNIIDEATQKFDLGKEIDHRFTIKGTVKEHSTFNGEKQTVLTRCKIVS